MATAARTFKAATPRKAPPTAPPEPKWSPPTHATTVYAGRGLVIFAGALLAVAVASALLAIWKPFLLVLTLPFAVGAGIAWRRWLGHRITVGPRGLFLCSMFGRTRHIPLQDVSRVRFLRVPQAGGRLPVKWRSTRFARSLQVPFESPQHSPSVGVGPSLFQMWIERHSGPQVRVNLDFLRRPDDIKVLYEGLPHVVTPRFTEPTGPSESLPKWW